jgi:hypothetical protein
MPAMVHRRLALLALLVAQLPPAGESVFEGVVRSIEPLGPGRGCSVTVDVTFVRRGPADLRGSQRLAVADSAALFGNAAPPPVGSSWLFRRSGSTLRATPWRDPVRSERLPCVERPSAELGSPDAVLLCGRRAAVEVFLREDRIGRGAFAPIDALRGIELCCEPALTPERIVWTPAGIVKEARAGDLVARSTWRVDAQRPCLRIDYEFWNGGSAEVELVLSAQVAANVGWVNKFVPHDDDLAEVEGGRVLFRDARVATLVLGVALQPAADRIELASGAQTPGAQSARFEKRLRIAPGGEARIALVAAGSDRPAELERLDLTAEPGSIAELLAGAFRFECPDPNIEEFVRACSAWPGANVRELPFGPPFTVDGSRNERWPVITASPDYHGIFANDCIQSLWELGLLGSGLERPARNSVESMFRFGPKESVEWWTGDGRVWSFPSPLGDTPQIVMGACWHLLWSGDRELAQRWWPDIRRCLAVLDANDADGDSLEDRPNTPYPEQPDPGTFKHEMLYVQCFWHQAFEKAAAVATWLGLDEARALREKAARIRRSIAEKFSTPYGLAVWLDEQHHPHPHIGHEAIIAAAEGDVDEAKAREVVQTALHAPIWTPDGPLRAEPGKGVAAGDHVWGFMRWKLVQALLRLGDSDRALELVERWAAEERALFYQAPEGFPTITGTTGKGYTWTAGRALRAIAIGFSGLELDGRGLRFAPRLPKRWDRFALRSITLHGTRVELEVRRGPRAVRVDGKPRADAAVGYDELRGETIRIEVDVP